MALKYLPSPRGEPADPLVAATRAQIKREFGLVSEPLDLHAAAPGILAAAWSTLRETVLVGEVPRRVKETVALAISGLNRCPYCVDAHASMLHATGARNAARALWRREREVEDPALAPLAAWAAATRSPGAAILRRPPFGPREAPELIGTASCFHYVNRMATIFLGETPFPVRGRLLGWPILLLTSRFFRPYVHGGLRAGESLRLLPEAGLPEDLSWAAPSPAVGAAFARFAAAVESAAREELPDEVERALRRRLEEWQGEDPPLGGAWIDEATEALAPLHRPAARLALLAALAPYRVDAEEVYRFRAAWPADRSLVAVTAWGSFNATRRLASWLVPTCP